MKSILKKASFLGLIFCLFGACKWKEIPLPAVVADFTFDPPTDAPATVKFMNASQNATSYEWDFGDHSAIDDRPDPVHVFEQPGSYPVTLRAFDGLTMAEKKDTVVVGIVRFEKLNANNGPAQKIIQLDDDRGFLIVGTNQSMRPYVLRTDALGEKIYDKSYDLTVNGPSSNVETTDALEMPDGSLLVVGSHFTGSDRDIFLLSINKQTGELKIAPQRLTDASSADDARSIALVGGNVLITGSATDLATNESDVLLISALPDLSSLLFREKIPLAGDQFGFETSETANGANLLIAGAGRASNGQMQPMILRTTANGKSPSVKLFGSLGAGSLHSISRSGVDFFACGYRENSGLTDLLMLKTDANGQAASGFPKAFGAAGTDEIGYEIRPVPSVGWAVASEKAGQSLLSFWSPSGEEIWSESKGSAGSSGIFYSVQPTSDGGFVAAGTLNSTLFWIKTDQKGKSNP